MKHPTVFADNYAVAFKMLIERILKRIIQVNDFISSGESVFKPFVKLATERNVYPTV